LSNGRQLNEKNIFSIVTTALLLISVLYFTSSSTFGVNAMEENNANYPDNVIDFEDYAQSDDPLERNKGYVRPEPRVFVPPSDESLKLTQEKVEAFDCSTIDEGVSKRECEALVALYASTNGADWMCSTNWLESPNIAEWYGVDTLYGGVSGLTLYNNNLAGPIPSKIGDLGNLVNLNLSGNFLSGRIPGEFKELNNLLNLDLSVNHLSGPIPSQIGMMPNIQNLSLKENFLSGQIPAALGQDSNLRELNLSGNQLSGKIPNELGNLNQLVFLGLSSNQLSGTIPPELGNLSNLRTLSLENNLLTGSIPAEFINLQNVSHIWLRDNRLSGSIPPEIGGMSGLRVLRLENNLLSGSLPPELKNSNIWDLYLANNQLSGEIPPELGQMCCLEYLVLSDNYFSGEIPSALFNAPLSILDLSSNKLTGSIPAGINSGENLAYLYLNNNLLSGTIPAEIGDLQNLVALNISDNKIEGAIPESFTNLVNLGPFTHVGYNRLNVPQEEVIENFLREKNPGWHLSQAIQETFSCELGGEMISRNGGVQIGIPADVCDGDMDVLLAPFSEPGNDYKQMSWAGNGFELNAWSEEDGVTQFQVPLSFTLYYSDGDFGPLPEDQLVIEFFDEEYMVWRDAVSTCPGGEYIRNTEENWVRVPVCSIAQFGLFILPERPYRLYVPMYIKN